jgi:hypothetical protein
MEPQDVDMQDPEPTDGPAASLDSILAESVVAICALGLEELEKLFLDLIWSDLHPPDEWLRPCLQKHVAGPY